MLCLRNAAGRALDAGIPGNEPLIPFPKVILPQDFSHATEVETCVPALDEVDIGMFRDK